MEPPFKPQVTSETDTRYFDEQFTREPVQLSPVRAPAPAAMAIQEEDVPYFEQFSYHGAKSLSEIGSAMSGLSIDMS